MTNELMPDIVEFQPANLVIPPITDPLGKGWSQPKTTDFLISDKFAKIKATDIGELYEYSHSLPTGVYNGKMWKTFDGSIWYLHWFGPHKDPSQCAIHTRKISIWL